MPQNFFVPSLIFAVEEDPLTGLITLVCIDGKQRCTSIRNFMDGSIPFVSPTTKVKYWWTKYGNAKRGMQLPELLKRQFESKIINSAEYSDISDTQQRDIFRQCPRAGIPTHTWRQLLKHRTGANGHVAFRCREAPGHCWPLADLDQRAGQEVCQRARHIGDDRRLRLGYGSRAAVSGAGRFHHDGTRPVTDDHTFCSSDNQLPRAQRSARQPLQAKGPDDYVAINQHCCRALRRVNWYRKQEGGPSW